MAVIVSMRGKRDLLKTAELIDWLYTNVKNEYIISYPSITFLNEDDALMFMLKFGGANATQNPSRLNLQKGSDEDIS